MRLLPILTILLIYTLYGCNTAKKTSSQSEKNKTTNENPSKFEMSPKSKQFVSEIRALSDNYQTLNLIKLSPEIIKKYSIQIQDSAYWVTGFIKTNDAFKIKNYNLKYYKINDFGEHKTIRFQLIKLPDFLTRGDITYFSISEQTELK